MSGYERTPCQLNLGYGKLGYGKLGYGKLGYGKLGYGKLDRLGKVGLSQVRKVKVSLGLVMLGKAYFQG